jgi:hypothetical protein
MLPDYLAVAIGLPCLIWLVAGSMWLVSMFLQDRATWEIRLMGAAHVPHTYAAWAETRIVDTCAASPDVRALAEMFVAQKGINVPWRAQA